MTTPDPAPDPTTASDHATTTDRATATNDGTATDRASASDRATALVSATASDPATATDRATAPGRATVTDDGTAVSPTGAALWQAARGPAVIAVLVVTVAIGLALVSRGGDGGALHPEDVGPTGSRALARIIGAEGVRVELVETTAAAVDAMAGGDATLLVTRPAMLLPPQLDAIARATRAAGSGGVELVLVAPADDALATFAPSLHEAGSVGVTDREPDCALADAAGNADLGGSRYLSTDAADRCYDDTLARVDGVTVVGSGVFLHNRHLDEDGNAALAMRLLGRHDRLVWYVPTSGDPATAGAQRPLSELMPAGWRFGTLQLAVAVVLLALWRARRLGPVVAEPLPVVVRGAETVEGMARLYRRAGARDRAADALRQATVSRIATMIGSTTEVPDAVAQRTGRDAGEVRRLLDGTEIPADDAALVRLADRLDALEKEVRRT